MIDDRTPAQALPLPHPQNLLYQDVDRLRQAIQALGSAVAQRAAAAHQHTVEQVSGLPNLLSPLASKTYVDEQTGQRAPLAHSHAIGQVNGLQSALDSKQPALVSGTTIKTVNGQSLLGGGDISVQSWAAVAASTPADNGTDLTMGTPHAVSAPSAYARYLPNAPAIGARVKLLDVAGDFARGSFTLRRRNAAHAINGKTEDVTFNFPAGIVTVEYASTNRWVLA